MPLNDEIIEEDFVEDTETTSDNSTDYPVDSPDSEIIEDDLVQDEEEEGSDSDILEDEPEASPEDEEEILETDTGDFSFDDEEEISSYSLEEVEVCTDLETFEASTVQVDLYQYTILNRLEFMQYALCIVIALLFLQIFVRYKK